MLSFLYDPGQQEIAENMIVDEGEQGVTKSAEEGKNSLGQLSIHCTVLVGMGR